MSFIQQVITSFKSYFKSIKFISEHKLWLWFLIPAILNMFLFILIGIGAWSYSNDLTNYFVDFFKLENLTGISILFWITLILIRILVLFVFLFIYKYIILILMSPALALFAEKIQTIQTGREIPFVAKTFIHNIFRGVGLALKNLAKEIIITFLILLLSLTGLLAPIVPLLLFIVNSYYYGFSMMDYKNELNGLSIKDSSKYVWDNKGMAVSNGIVFNLIMLIPFVGVLISPMLALNAVFISMEENKKGSLN